MTALAALCLLPTSGGAAESGGGIVIEDVCQGPHEAGPADGGGCLCDLGYFYQLGECRSPARDWLSGDICAGFAGCGSGDGGGGGGGGGTPPEEPEDEEQECTLERAEQAAKEMQACTDLNDAVLETCQLEPAEFPCVVGMWPGGKQSCAKVYGILVCDVPGVGRIVGSKHEIESRCIEEWAWEVGPSGTLDACEARAAVYHENCLHGVEHDYPECLVDDPGENDGPYGSTSTTTDPVLTTAGESSSSSGASTFGTTYSSASVWSTGASYFDASW